MPDPTRYLLACLLPLTFWSAAPARAQANPGDGFDWVTIDHPGNRGYDGPTNINGTPYPGFPEGRGSVPYTFRISRLEITTAQWLEYLNAFTTQSDSMAFFLREPVHWGAQSDLAYTGPGRRYALNPAWPGAAMLPVAGITWREAARYVNWINNDKSRDPASLNTGAYDTSTWGNGPTGGAYTDAQRHLPGARYWIPTLDEYLKASHYDPDKRGPGADGWWLYNNRSDTHPAAGGLPGAGETSAGTGEWRIPLGSYPQTTSAFGLLDLSGGASEWLEDIRPNPTTTYRLWDGDWIDFTRPFGETADSAFLVGEDDPTQPNGSVGLRIASVPSPSGLAGLGFAVATWWAGRRRRSDEGDRYCRHDSNYSSDGTWRRACSQDMF